MATKRKRTAKQKAATRKLVALNKRRRSSTPKKRKRSVRKVIKSVTTRRVMPRRRRSSMRRSSSRKSGFIPPKAKSLLKNVMIGLGAGATVSTIGSLVGQPALGQNKLVSTAASFVVGGPVAAGISFLLSPGGIGLPGLGGGNGAQGGI